MKTGVVIPAAGKGKRMEAGMNKLFIPIRKKPILIHTLETFVAHERVDQVVIVVNPGELKQVQQLLHDYRIQNVQCVIGGEERQHSVHCGLHALQDVDVAMVHDGARPFIHPTDIHRLHQAMETEEAALLAVPVKDTIKVADEHAIIDHTPERESLWAAQTPQAFRLPVLLEAYASAERDGFIGTDDASLVERRGKKIKLVHGSYDNIKVTTPDDLFMSEIILERRRESGN